MPSARRFPPAACAAGLLLAACLSAALPVPAGAAPGCAGDEVPAAELVPPALLGGEDFRVDPCARLTGHMARFTLRPAGPGAGAVEPPAIVVESIDLLELRVLEMELLRRLRAIGRASAAGQAAMGSLQQTGSAVGSVVSRPVESVVGLPAGALRFFGRQVERAGRQVADAGERAWEHFDSPLPPETRLRPEVEETLPAEPEPWWRRGSGLAFQLGKRWLGYTAARRDLARRLGTDPYTRNPWLDAEMDRLAWAALVGRRSAGFGLGQIGGAAGIALSESSRIHRMVWEQPPEEVRRWNARRLAPLACSPEAQDEFFDNGRFSPTLQTQAVDALMELVPQAGCDAFLQLAAGVEREAEARYVVDLLQLLVAARPRFPVRFEPVGSALVLRDGEERLFLALPVDRLQWTPMTRDFFAQPGFASAPDKRALIGREASPEARAALLAAGWSVFEHAIGPAREASAAIAAQREDG